MRNPQKDQEDFGMLGKNEVNAHPLAGGMGGFGITDKMINSLMRNLMRSLDKQFKGIGEPGMSNNTEIKNLPNGIKIRVDMPKRSPVHAEPQESADEELAPSHDLITDEQIQRMTGKPRAEAKTNVRRLSDKVLYELTMPGVDSADDVFISKLESGYEVKAIGKKKVYVNSLPVNLPLKSYEVDEKGLIVEFSLQ